MSKSDAAMGGRSRLRRPNVRQRKSHEFRRGHPGAKTDEPKMVRVSK
jgi:hypothetical protein